jgi:hypothetical protein
MNTAKRKKKKDEIDCCMQAPLWLRVFQRMGVCGRLGVKRSVNWDDVNCKDCLKWKPKSFLYVDGELKS